MSLRRSSSSFGRPLAIFFTFLCLLHVLQRHIPAHFSASAAHVRRGAPARCSQRLFEAKGDPSPGSNGFSVEVHDAPPGLEESGPDALQGLKWNDSNGQQAQEYVPGKAYVISVRGWSVDI